MPESLRIKLYNQIRDDITYGKLSPGERLVEAKLAEQYQSSRSPIREALRQLESEGLLTFERNKGISVSKLSINQVDEIYKVRWVLESYAAHQMAERATKKQVENLKSLQKKLRKAAKHFNLLDWLHNNALFHQFLIMNSGNSNLTQILDGLIRRTYRYHYIIIRIPGHFDSYLKDHEGIIEALEKADGEKAEKHMKHHLEEIRNTLIDHLTHGNFPVI
jgi:DNA-binding GntR family transcriptional regulator